ncbi:MAG: ferric reductase-like transmembrane domain-containing protein [bacterium]|nr:ferric reductase-like transmembrane domain-containing protein [bacterium]
MASWILTVILASPLAYMVLLTATNGLGANPVERLLILAGQGTLSLLIFLLALPGTAKLSGWAWPKAWMRHRRAIGLSIFAYASLHMLLWLADQLGEIDKLVDNLARPFTASGLASWVILFLLAVTSNRFSIKKLGRRWKSLHRWVFFCIPLLFIHITLKDEGIWWSAALWLGPISLWVLLAPKFKKNKPPSEAR